MQLATESSRAHARSSARTRKQRGHDVYRSCSVTTAGTPSSSLSISLDLAVTRADPVTTDIAHGDRDDFLHSVVQFWSDHFTDPVVEQVTSMGGSARERIRHLLRVVSEGRFARYDVSIRAWAAQDPDLLAAIVKEVDKRRLAFVASLFTEAGFEEPEADMRARNLVAYVSFEESVLAKSSKKARSELLNRFGDLITQGAIA